MPRKYKGPERRAGSKTIGSISELPSSLGWRRMYRRKKKNQLTTSTRREDKGK